MHHLNDISADAMRLSPDSELLALCAQFEALTEEFFADPRDQPCGSLTEAARDANDARISIAQRALLSRIEFLPPIRTLEGARALARAVLREDTELLAGLREIYLGEALQATFWRKLSGDASSRSVGEAA